VTYNAPFSISTPDAASITKVTLVRIGAVTHSVNMEQRYIPLSFSAANGALNATSPVNANVAPPGVYMLFAINSSGVPSVAKMVWVGSAPTISFVTPAEGATGVAGTTSVVVAFDHTMDKPSAEAAFSLKRTGDGSPVSGTFGWYGNALIFSPSAPLAAGTSYTAKVDATAKDTAGTSLGVPKSWQFTTFSSPAVSSVSPVDGATNVSRSSVTYAIFNKAMDKPSAEAAFSLKRTSDGAAVSGNFSWYGNALIFSPRTPLASATSYTATVGATAKDTAGNPLDAPKSWQFTTATQPIVSSVSPADGATGVPRGAAVYAIFDRAMDKPSAEAAFSLKRTSDGSTVSGSFGWYGNALILKPSADLAAGTQYTAAVSGAAKDQAGNSLANPTTWRFTTGN
jgi:hypothetical protein